MSKNWKTLLLSLLAGLVFGAGLVVSGMTRPSKVIGFLDPLGRWDASLMFVMASAVTVHFLAYRWVRRRPSPFLAQSFAIPTRRDLDLKLLAGAAMFGVGWGLGGFCPGPSLVSLGSAAPQVLAFVSALVIGMYGTGKLEALALRRTRQRREREAAEKVIESAA